MKAYKITYTRNFFKGTEPRIFTAKFNAPSPEAAIEKLLEEMERKSKRIGKMPYWEILTVESNN